MAFVLRPTGGQREAQAGKAFLKGESNFPPELSTSSQEKDKTHHLTVTSSGK